MKNPKMNRRKVFVDFDYKRKNIIEKSNDRTYKDCVFLNPGMYTDHLSMQKVSYPETILSEFAENWPEQCFLDIDHNITSVLSRIGFVENQHWNGKAVVGDIRILPITTFATDTISLIDAGLITDLSIEAFTEDGWNDEKGCIEVTKIEFIGVGVVTKGADENAKINS